MSKAKSHLNMSMLLRTLVYFSAIFTVGILAGLILYMLVMGIPNLKLDLFAWKYTSDNASVVPAFINTLLMVVVTLLMAVPVGICSAIYLVEYSNKASKFVKIIRVTTETLSGIPSIVYGLFGYLCFSVFLKLGYSLLSGAFTLSIMVLPAIMICLSSVTDCLVTYIAPPRLWDVFLLKVTSLSVTSELRS